ncbi:Uncharacterised protein [Candidatus Anstonella stagnisolia]|nr:Uncharacterised protein [Candidatus Anstonella stagnisolia]
MKKMNLFVLLVLLGAFGLAFAEAQPILQISNYTTVPTDVYPGTLGYLQLKLSNNGDATAEAVSAQYTLEGSTRTLSISDISAGSNTQVSVPFKIDNGASGSLQLITIEIYYNYEKSGGGTNSKKTSLTVPIVVKQYSPLEARTLSIDNAAISPGEKLTLHLELRNTGGVVNNLLITTPANSSFSIEGSTQLAVGSIPAGSGTNVTLVLLSSSDAKTGTYAIPVLFTYQDATKQPTQDTLYVGPIAVLSSSVQYRVFLEPLAPVEIGAQVPFRLTLQNTGSSPISATLDINSTDAFTPIGVQRLYFDSVPAGKSASKNITIGVSASKSSGFYTLPLVLTPSSGQPTRFDAGLAVSATPEITVTLDSQSGATQVQIANTGNSQIRSVYASAGFTGSQSVSESFMGTLNVDDFATLSLAGNGPSVNVVVRYRDSNNAEHVENTTLERSAVFTGVTGASGSSGASQNSATGNFRQGANNNPLGFLTGGRQGASAGSPLGIAIPIAAVVVVAIVGFFAYKHFTKAKKESSPKPEEVAISAHAKPDSLKTGKR